MVDKAPHQVYGIQNLHFRASNEEYETHMVQRETYLQCLGHPQYIFVYAISILYANNNTFVVLLAQMMGV